MIKYDIEVIDSAGDTWLIKDMDKGYAAGPAFVVAVIEKVLGGEVNGIIQPDHDISHTQYFFNPIRVACNAKEV